MLDTVTVPTNPAKLAEFLRSLETQRAAQHTAFLIFMFGLVRAVDEEHRQSIKETLKFALDNVPEEFDGDPKTAAYHEALDTSLNELIGMVESKPGGSPHE